MKRTVSLLLYLAAFAAVVALACQNRSLRASLARAEAQLAAGGAGAPRPSPETAPAAAAAESGTPPKDAPTQPPPGGMDGEAFEKAVEERAAVRAEEIARARRDEREARRREWENATEEEREEHRRQFQARMQEHATAQITEFETKAGLDVEQCSAFEMELEAFDAKVRAIAERFAVMIDGGVPAGFEMQARIMNEMSTAALDAYAGINEVLPEGWREKGGDFNMIFGMSPSSMNPLFDAMRRTGVFGRRGPGPFGPFRGRGR